MQYLPKTCDSPPKLVRTREQNVPYPHSNYPTPKFHRTSSSQEQASSPPAKTLWKQWGQLLLKRTHPNLPQHNPWGIQVDWLCKRPQILISENIMPSLGWFVQLIEAQAFWEYREGSTCYPPVIFLERRCVGRTSTLWHGPLCMWTHVAEQFY